METLSRLFGSEAKVKIMRLFLFNPEKVFDISVISERTKTDAPKVRREMNILEKMGLVRRRVAVKNGNKKAYILDPQFVYLKSLQNFLINVDPLQPKEIIKKITKLGSIKLILVSGVFIQEPDSRADLLIVGDNIKKSNLEHTIKILESEIGKELRYAYFTTSDFNYRLSMFDKLLRDILDYPHRKLLSRLPNI
jgi:predicted transcriptional regulator